MAHINHVEQATANYIASQLFTGPYTLGNVQTSKTHKIRLHRGRPAPQTLKEDLANKVTTITVSPAQGWARETSRYGNVVRHEHKVPITFNAFAEKGKITFSGSATAGQVVGVGVHDIGYSIRLESSDTPETVASEFASRIPFATAEGNVLFIDNPHLFAGVVSDIEVVTEIRRQTQIFNITIDSHSVESRDSIGALVDMALAKVRVLALADKTLTTKPRYMGSQFDDFVHEKLYRQTMRFEIEYATTTLEVFPAALHVGVGFNYGKTGRFHPDDN